MRRLALIGLAVSAAIAVAAPGASAHALLTSSEPQDGAKLESPPQAVTLTFTEEPEPRLSVVKVLDTSGADHASGPPQVPAPRTLRVGVRVLAHGTYTVSWRVVSRVDGHVTAGAFAFGVGISPAPVEARSAPKAPPPSPLAVGGRFLFYAGVVSLLGGAWVAALAFGEPPSVALRLAVAASVIGLLGVAVLGAAQYRDAGARLSTLLGTSLGRALVLRAVALAAAAVAAVTAVLTSKGARRAWLVVAWAAAAAAVVVHVSAGHSAAGSWRTGKVAVQSAHVIAVGVWIGGLAAILLAGRGTEDESKATAVRRFSAVAGVALAVVAGTGITRAVDEVGAWSRLLSTGFGRLVILKVALLGALVVLGAVNRYRNVPRAGSSQRPLRAVGVTELGLAAVVLAATGLLSSLAPPSTAAASQPRPLVTSGSDYGTTVRVRLEVTPGVPGLNRVVVHVSDHDTRRPVSAQGVTLRFVPSARPDVGPSELALRRTGPGRYEGSGSNLSLEGAWDVTATVERGVESVEVPLRLRTRERPQRVTVLRTPGQPTIYSVDLGDTRRVQLYLDPERPGTSELHATFLQGSGELPVGDGFAVVATPPPGTAASLPVRRFGPGHFVADVTLVPGRWRFDLSVPGGLEARISVAIP